MTKDKTVYSQVWEDYQTTKEALALSPRDVVLTISGGGDNLLNMLLEEPRLIYSVDINLAQIALCQLKMAAFAKLTYADMLALLGVKSSRTRIKLYQKIKPFLSVETSEFWNKNIKNINYGLLNCGRVEKRILPLIRLVLKLLLGKEGFIQILKLKNRQQQRLYFNHYFKKHNRLLTRFLLRIVINNNLIKLLTYPTNPYIDFNFDYCLTYLKKIFYSTDLPAEFKSNYYLHQFLFGKYLSFCLMPPYLLKRNFTLIKKNVVTIRLLNTDILSFLIRQPNNSIDKFNLSDIFEPWCSNDQFKNTLVELKRVSKNGSLVFFREILTKRKIPPDLKRNFVRNPSLEKSLLAKDRTLYNKLNILTIEK